jgi:hypothetical protein
VQNDEAEMRAIFQQLGRINLLSLERFPAADRSTTLKDLKVRLRRLAGRTLILVDGDNFPNAPTIGLDLFPPPLPPNTDLGFLVASFVSQVQTAVLRKSCRGQRSKANPVVPVPLCLP